MPYNLESRIDGHIYVAGASMPVYDAETEFWMSDAGRLYDPSGAYSVVHVDEAPSYPPLTPIAFYLAFKPSERMIIKALAGTVGIPAASPLLGGLNTAAIPPDPVVAEFWATYLLSVQTATMISPGLISIQEGLAYLAAPSAPTPVIITTARIPQISSGIAQ